jgi:hypothetical protein
LPRSARKSAKKTLTICAVGDVGFLGKVGIEPKKDVFERVKFAWYHSDILIANLETVLHEGSDAAGNKCSLKADPRWADILAHAGISVVSLANNHIMDYGSSGLTATRGALDEAGVRYFGAGTNIAEALAPLYMDANGTRVALLGRSSVVVSSPCYASGKLPGVAPFDLEETRHQIKECKRQADITALVLHWGVEHYRYPAPKQRREARELIQAGADLIIGHHPHVLQGIERISDGLVCYSLGNFVFDDLDWCFVDKDGKQQQRSLQLSQANREGGILRLALSEIGFDSYEFIPTHIDPDGRVRIEDTIERRREFSRLCLRLHRPWYSFSWRIYSLRQEWKLRIKPMTIGRLKWANLRKFRPKHFRELYNGIRRSGKITAEKSTNPYE